MEFTIFSEYVPDVIKKLEAMKRKADRYGAAFSYTIGNEHPAVLNQYQYDEFNHCAVKVNQYNVSAVDIDIDYEELIKANGWTVAAKIEHYDNGNIVYPFEAMSEDEMEKWAKALPYCEHCHTHRKRNVTYVCKHSDGTVKQIGSSCLKDYTGINPITAVAWAEIRETLDKGMTYEGEFRTRSCILYSPIDVIACAVNSIEKNGYIKSDSPNSTKMDVCKLLDNYNIDTDKTRNEAIDIYNWLRTNEFKFCDFEYNASVIAKNTFCKASQIGVLAYTPIAYKKYKEHKIKMEKRAEIAKLSNYVGELKDRITFKAVSTELVTSFDGAYGTTYLYKFVDESNNVFTWFASSCYDINGKSVTIKGTVKNHKEFNGEKQTILTRCKIL